jgi:BirA family transcriptional regulator, biotin operon repressor / biotin---[acetyl-CoA-carboxylase] ligase
VLGVGVNVAVDLELMPVELRGRAATLGRPPDAIEPLLQRVLEVLSRLLAQAPAAALQAWRERDALQGRAIAWGEASEAGAQSGQASTAPAERAPEASPERGMAAGIDDDGHLIVTLADGRRETLQAGEVHLRTFD